MTPITGAIGTFLDTGVVQSYVSTGIGGSFKAGSAGAFLAWLTATLQMGAPAQGLTAIYLSTTGIPAAGSAPGGGDTQLVQLALTPQVVADIVNDSFSAIVSGLTAGQTYFFYVAVASPSGTSAFINITALFGLIF